MILTSHQQPKPTQEFKTFLKAKIGLNEDDLQLGIKQADAEQAPLAIILWSFGIITLEQYEEILDWQNIH